ncbi:MAG: beta-mannosidase [Ruminococcus sp.]|nr:beta-mannosidase [Ruminococcus sp.]
MKNKLKKALSLISAVAVSAVSLSSVIPAYAVKETKAELTQFPYTIEGEDLEGAELWTSIYENQIPDYSGKGFAYLTSGALSFKVTVEEDGMYNISAKVAQILDQNARMQTISVNGAEYSKNVPYYDKWTDFDFGTVRLKAGENEISFLNKYGYMAVDNVTISVAEKKDYSLATGATCDAEATPETKSLMKYLKSIYGKHTISGQQEIYGGGHSGNYEWENEFLEKLTGKVPAIRGLDFMNYNPLYGWDDGSTERAIEWVKEKNGIITASWHINVPIDFDNYEIGDELDWKKCTYQNYQASGSTFNTANVIKEDTKEREYFEEAMKMLAEQLQKLQDENVPIIFRPLHEAQGNEGNYGDGTSWFWWGDRGAEVYKELWKLLYTTLTEKYELHNIIWEFNSYDYSNSHTWYPGDEYVDIVAYDKYNVENNRGDGKSSGPNLRAISEKFDYLFKLTKGTKMVAMAENDTVPALENMLIEDANWLYFCPWYDGGEDGGTAFLGENYQDHEELTKMYQSEYCITLDELPENLYSFDGGEEPPKTTATTGKNTSTTTTTAKTTGSGETKTTTTTSKTDTIKPKVLGDANDDGNVNVSDAVLIMQSLSNPDEYKLTEQGRTNADVVNQGDGVTAMDALAIQLIGLNMVKAEDFPITTEELNEIIKN